VRISYFEWDENLLQRLLQFQTLMNLFNYLLVRSGGDVNRAFKWMEDLQAQGILPDEFDLKAFKEQLEKENLVERVAGSPKLTSKGQKKIRQDSLNEIFTSLKKSGSGNHPTPATGIGGEKLPETRPYQFGDEPAAIDYNRSIHNAIVREGLEYIRMNQEDLEVHDTEHMATCATVLLLDVSHSMVLYGEDRITPAKRVAMALSELIQTQYPKDDLHVAVFGDDAVEVKVRDIMKVQAGPYYTNTAAALRLARRILDRKRGLNKQIFMITDGKCSAIFDGGRIYRNAWGLDPKIVSKTLREASLCRKKKIPITTFMVADDPYLIKFIEKLTKVNQGRAYYTPSGSLGSYLFVDFIRNRRKNIH
jgi:uncharacterized protein with von Willebrand factor type A (vWA) domain